jgi:hypothetical protein
MKTSNEDTALLHEQIWTAWVQKGRLQDKATARKSRVAVITLFILALAAVLYMFAIGQGSLVQT